jgi:D-sedoheptulose 7-phosphate isomerase
MQQKIRRSIEESIEAKRNLSAKDIEGATLVMIAALKSGRKVLLAGNGGSAADCQHMAGELVGRFKKERKPLPAISLTTDTSILTAIANDYGAEFIFSRQVEAHGLDGDVLIAFSTSGASPNIIKAIEAARKEGMKVIGFTGSKGARMKALCDVCITAPSDDTPRIQECHTLAAHIICGLVEEALF